MASMKPLVGVSDVSVGYGSPEIIPLMVSLADHFGYRPLLIEPDEITRPPAKLPMSAGLTVERIPSVWDTYSLPFRIEYVNAAARRVNELQPDVLVLFCTLCIPVLFKLRYRPRFIIYHSYELVTKSGRFDVEMNRQASSLIDLVIFCEENRARIDIAACGYEHAKKVVAYNCGDLVVERPRPPLSADQRNGKIIYYGTLAGHLALSEYFTRARTQGIPIDLYGRVMEQSDEQCRSFLSRIQGSVRYYGLLDAEELVERRRRYAYSIVMWNPTISAGHYYVSPNRLFSSIQAGVPLIVAPHPQCKIMVERYDCGIVMRDWTYKSFRAALEKAMMLYGTPRYAEMVDNCRRAAESDLNWKAQFEKIRRLLPDDLRTRDSCAA